MSIDFAHRIKDRNKSNAHLHVFRCWCCMLVLLVRPVPPPLLLLPPPVSCDKCEIVILVFVNAPFLDAYACVLCVSTFFVGD